MGAPTVQRVLSPRGTQRPVVGTVYQGARPEWLLQYNLDAVGAGIGVVAADPRCDGYADLCITLGHHASRGAIAGRHRQHERKRGRPGLHVCDGDRLTGDDIRASTARSQRQKGTQSRQERAHDHRPSMTPTASLRIVPNVKNNEDAS